MEIERVIPLGAWCRCAYQARCFFPGVEAGPFDWTITPFAALKLFLELDHTESVTKFSEFKFNNLILNKVGSVTDNATGIIYHHYLGPDKIKYYLTNDSANDLSESFINSRLLTDVRSLYQYLYTRLTQQLKSDNCLYIRWVRYGHPDQQFKHVFLYESPEELYRLLEKAKDKDADFRLVYLSTKLQVENNNEINLASIKDICPDKKWVHIEICERSWLFNTFHGDTESWGYAFELAKNSLNIE